MIKNRIISVLCFAVFSLCLAYAQTSGRWIKYFEDEDGIYSYQSDLKTDMYNNHYVWIKYNLTSPKERLEWTNTLKSNVPINYLQARIVFDSDFELMKPVQFMVLSKQGKVLAEFKSDIFFEWMELSKDHFVALKNRLRGNSSNQSGKVYDKLLEKIREKQLEKQLNQEEKSRNREELWDDVLEDEEQKQEKQAIEEQRVFDVVEEMPQFPGGPSALFEYLSKSIKYPVIAEDNGVQGRVLVTFIVERDGSITEVKVVKSVDPSLDQEAKRVVESMPHWIPGKQGGNPVRVNYTVPVTFKLQ